MLPNPAPKATIFSFKNRQKMKSLILPVKPNALCVEQTKRGIPASFDFSKLPYVGDGYDHSPDTPFLSKAIANYAFARPEFVLRDGIHLHWMPPPIFRQSMALPVITMPFLVSITTSTEVANFLWNVLVEAGRDHTVLFGSETLVLTKSFHLWEDRIPQSIKDQTELYALLSDRLNGFTADGTIFPAVPTVWKIRRIGTNGAVKEWTVESDFIHDSPPKNEHLFSQIPWLDMKDGSKLPYRFIGRVLTGEEKEMGLPEQYLSNHSVGPLTALGYGELSFSSFYPNCISVFGFCDPEINSAQKANGIEYHISGMYRDSKFDYLSHLSGYVQSKAMQIDDAGERKNFVENWVKDHLSVYFDIENNQLPERVVCFGRIKLQKTFKSLDERVEVTIGNSGTEAIAASLSNELGASQLKTVHSGESFSFKPGEIEDLIESIMMRDRVQTEPLDFGFKFREWRHENEFYASQSGSRWVIQSSLSDDEAEPKNPTELNDRLLTLLSALNQDQRLYDELANTIQSLKQEAYDYWHHYMDSLYVNEFEIDTYPLPDDLKDLMEVNILPKLKTQQAKSAEIQVKIREKRKELFKALTAFKTLRLISVPAARFWHPKEPVICIKGELLKGLLNEDGEPEDKNKRYMGFTHEIAPNQMVNFADLGGAAWNELVESHFTFSIFNPTKTWNALLLDWQLEYFPVSGKLKPNRPADHYASDYLTSNYTLPHNQTELKKNSQAHVLTDKVAVFEGRSALSPFPQKDVRSQILKHCKDLLQLDENEEVDKEHIIQLLSDFPEQEKRVSLLLAALQSLDVQTRLTQSLSGFHQALMGRRAGWQLPVADPLGFEFYQNFALSLNHSINAEMRSAPIAHQPFHPLRTGEVAIQKLRLIDSFGQFQDLPIGKVIGAKDMAGSDTNRVLLPPRFVQGMRLNFRWMDYTRNSGFESVNSKKTSPIIGWILPEYLERKILVFDPSGRALGGFGAGQLENGTAWENTPALDGLKSIAEMDEGRLKAFCQSLKDEIEAKHIDVLLAEFYMSDSQIQPEQTRDGDFIARLFGQPLAIVQAHLSLELQGKPKTSATWDECWNRINHPNLPASDDGVPGVEIKVRIGEHDQLNDGVVRYWNWQNESHLANIRSPYMQHDDFIKISVNTDVQDIGLLMHPRGRVHLTTGVLPVKTIDLPDVHIEQVMKNLQGTLSVTPLLTDAEALQMPLPALMDHQWNWVQPEIDQELSAWRTQPWRLQNKTVIRDGWIQIGEKRINNFKK